MINSRIIFDKFTDYFDKFTNRFDKHTNNCQILYKQQIILTKYENLIAKKRKKNMNVEDFYIDYIVEISELLHEN